MVHRPEVSQLHDESRIEKLVNSTVPQPAHMGILLLDSDLRVRGLNATYQNVCMRPREELIGQFIFDVFPDDPADAQASGSARLSASVDAALRRRGADSMPIVRYDITDPRDPDVFMPKLWACTNAAVEIGHDTFGVLHRVREITSLDEALSALAASIADGVTLGAAEQLHVLSALAAAVREDRESARTMAQDNLQLRRALETRDTIGQAKGMLMERYDIDAAAAFDLLCKLSQQSNIRLVEVAEKLIDLDHPSTTT